jgi:hypothetical protein
MLEAIRKGAPGSLVGFLYTPEKVIDNWRDRVDRTKASYTLDKLEAERQLRTAKLNAVNVDTSAKLTELKASEPDKGDLPKLVKVAPLKDVTKAGTTITSSSDKQPIDNKGAKPKVPRPKVDLTVPCITPECKGMGLFRVPGGWRCSPCNILNVNKAAASIPERSWNAPEEPKEETSWVPWRRTTKSWNNYTPGTK